MLQKIFVFATLIFLSYSLALAQYNGDPRLAPISADALRKAIKSTPIDSPSHFHLLSRAYDVNLAKNAYEQYALLWKNSPNDANTNLLVGIAAKQYMKQAMLQTSDPETTKRQIKRYNALHLICRARLAESVKLAPDSTTAHVAYGFFLWQNDNQQEKGLRLVKKGVALNPKSTGGHATLGAIYSNSSGKAYNPTKAITELKTAIALDSKFAYPHERLAWLYVELKKYKEAKRSFEKLLSLSPDNTIKKPAMQLLQSLINKGLSSR
ncbi:MAG TPA: tetratricopeptide repeat protein [Abditibacteriaceae bacterium]